MATRKIKDAKDLSSNELIYFKGHAKATYMSDGTTVEDAINNIEVGDNTDLSNYATKLELNLKQDIIEDIDTIRLNASNYKGTVTSIKIDNVTKTSSNGVVDLGYINKLLVTTTDQAMILTPNVYYRNTSTSLSKLTIMLSGITNSNILNEYFVEFTTSSSGTTISLPTSIKWVNGEVPSFESGTTYQISIINNLGVVTKFK